MSVRGAEGAAGSGAPTNSEPQEAGERRGGAGNRVHFEALVAVGEAAGRSGFEAESMDVSPEGMRLRTAYLPEVGDRLICRFDGAGAEVVTEGEVIWRDEQDRGGEFGIRFLTLDDRAAEMLRGMCAPADAGPAPAPAGGSGAPRGTRVRLHIDGLGSPMKARVRETSSGEILVGSNLEFLRVGRALEIEDVDHGQRREATIDHVRVEVDAETNVPQLVVSLRCEGMGPAKRASSGRITLPFGATAGNRPAADAAASEPWRPDPPRKGASEAGELDHERAAGHGGRATALAAPAHAERVAESTDGASSDDDDPIDDDDGGRPGKNRLAGAGAKAAKVSLAAAKKIAPALSSVGARAKGAMAMALMSIRMKRAEREEAKKAAQPRRTTAPAPSGALKSDGRRLVREESADEDAPPPPAPRSNKKAAALGSVLGLIAVLGVFGLTRTLRAPSRSAEAPVESATVAARTDAPPALPAGTGPVSANVPLFGATPLSTTEAVPSIPTPSPSGAPAADPAAAAPTDPGQAEAGGDEPGMDDDEGPGSKEWGNDRPVKNPVVLRIKMDGEIERINGASGAMGFTVSLPGRRSLSAASELARKDKRVASVNVVNNAHGAEVTVQFKDGVPAFLARARGERLEIALGSEGKAGGSKLKKVAKASGDHAAKKKKADGAKKSADKGGKAKAGAKKKDAKKH